MSEKLGGIERHLDAVQALLEELIKESDAYARAVAEGPAQRARSRVSAGLAAGIDTVWAAGSAARNWVGPRRELAARALGVLSIVALALVIVPVLLREGESVPYADVPERRQTDEGDGVVRSDPAPDSAGDAAADVLAPRWAPSGEPAPGSTSSDAPSPGPSKTAMSPDSSPTATPRPTPSPTGPRPPDPTASPTDPPPPPRPTPTPTPTRPPSPSPTPTPPPPDPSPTPPPPDPSPTPSPTETPPPDDPSLVCLDVDLVLDVDLCL